MGEQGVSAITVRELRVAAISFAAARILVDADSANAILAALEDAARLRKVARRTVELTYRACWEAEGFDTDPFWGVNGTAIVDAAVQDAARAAETDSGADPQLTLEAP